MTERAVRDRPHRRLSREGRGVGRAPVTARSGRCRPRQLLALGFEGSERTTRRAVAKARGHSPPAIAGVSALDPRARNVAAVRLGHGPRIAGPGDHALVRLARWSRFRVVIPTGIERCRPWSRASTRPCGGSAASPTYALTDNRADGHDRPDRRHRRAPPGESSPPAAHYGLQITACVPFDPESKGGQRSDGPGRQGRPRADRANLLAAYGSFAELRAACDGFCETVNGSSSPRDPRGPGRPPEIGTRAAAPDPGGGSYSRVRCHPFSRRRRDPPLRLCSLFGSSQACRREVWVRVAGDELVVTSPPATVPRGRASCAHDAWQPRIDPAHYPARTSDPLHPKPKAASPTRRHSLVWGPAPSAGSSSRASGAERIRTKIRRATELAMLVGAVQVDRALGLAARPAASQMETSSR